MSQLHQNAINRIIVLTHKNLESIESEAVKINELCKLQYAHTHVDYQ